VTNSLARDSQLSCTVSQTLDSGPSTLALPAAAIVAGIACAGWDL